MIFRVYLSIRAIVFSLLSQIILIYHDFNGNFRILKWRYLLYHIIRPYFVRIFPYIGLKHRPYIYIYVYMYICVYIRCLQFRLLKWPCRISRVNNRLTEFIDQFIPGGHHLVVISIYLSILSCLVLSTYTGWWFQPI